MYLPANCNRFAYYAIKILTFSHLFPAGTTFQFQRHLIFFAHNYIFMNVNFTYMYSQKKKTQSFNLIQR